MMPNTGQPLVQNTSPQAGFTSRNDQLRHTAMNTQVSIPKALSKAFVRHKSLSATIKPLMATKATGTCKRVRW